MQGKIAEWEAAGPGVCDLDAEDLERAQLSITTEMETVRLRLEGWEQIKVRARPMSNTTPTLTTTAIPFIATAFRQTEESSLELTRPIDSALTMSLFMLQGGRSAVLPAHRRPKAAQVGV